MSSPATVRLLPLFSPGLYALHDILGFMDLHANVYSRLYFVPHGCFDSRFISIRTSNYIRYVSGCTYMAS